VLAGIAGLVLWGGSAGPAGDVLPGPGELLLALVLAAILAVVGLEGWFVLLLMQQQGRLLARLEALEARLGSEHVATGTPVGVPIDAPAPRFALPELGGDVLTLDALCARGLPVLLVFVAPECDTCLELLPEIGRWQRAYTATLTVAALSRGTPDDNLIMRQHDIGDVLLEQDDEVARTYQVARFPSAVIVGPDGAIGSILASGMTAIGALVEQAVASRASRSAIQESYSYAND
jgi:methylamine dehydrogenase accessory protein MauD